MDWKEKLIVIARKVGIPAEDLKDMRKVVEYIYDYITSLEEKDTGGGTSNIMDILEIVRGSKALEDPTRAYLLLKSIEEKRYKEGFEDGIKVATSKEYSKVRERESKIIESVLKLYEENIIPVLNNMMATFRAMFPNPQTQQPSSSIKIKFKE